MEGRYGRGRFVSSLLASQPASQPVSQPVAAACVFEIAFYSNLDHLFFSLFSVGVYATIGMLDHT